MSSIAAEGLRDSGGRLSDGRDHPYAPAPYPYPHQQQQPPSSFALPPHTGLRPHEAMLDPQHRLSHPGAPERLSHERLSYGGRLSGPPPPHRQHSPNSPPNGPLGASPAFFPISEQEEDGVRLSNLSTFSTGGMDIVAGGPGPCGEGQELRESLK